MPFLVISQGKICSVHNAISCLNSNSVISFFVTRSRLSVKLNWVHGSTLTVSCNNSCKQNRLLLLTSWDWAVLLDPLVRKSALFLGSTLTAWTCNQASNSILFNLLYRNCDSLGWLVAGWPRAYLRSRTLEVLTRTISFPFHSGQRYSY